MIKAEPHIAAMSPYALAKMVPPPGKPLISLSQNESLRPPSPAVILAATRALESGALYPDPDWRDLRLALAEQHALATDQILCGNGSLDLIGALARVYAGPKRAVLAPANAYPFFRTSALMVGARFDSAKETAFAVCVDALLEAVQPDTGIVFVANPANPTGTRIDLTELQRLRAGLRPEILLVIDEAYGEFCDDLNERAFDMAHSGNTLLLRTFSKAYGMAGFRVGWGCFPPEIAAELRKVLNPNNIATASQAAAIAALQDQTYMRETVSLTRELRDFATEQLEDLGLQVAPSHTNFVLIDLKNRQAAENTDAALRQRGIFLRPQAGAGLPGCLRMTIGPKESLTAALDVLKHLKQEPTR